MAMLSIEMEKFKVSRANIHVLGKQGYVWDAEEAFWLRLECGLVGAMVGGVAGFKQQNAVHGLPLQLCPEEVTLALDKGWAVLQPALNVGPLTAAAAEAAASKKRGRSGYHMDDSEDEQYDDYGDDVMPNAEPLPWQAAVSKGEAFTIPIAVQQALPAAGAAAAGAAAAGGVAAGSAGRGSQASEAPRSEAAAAGTAAEDQQQQQQEQGGAGGAVEWTFPATEEERHRYWVFRDLHKKGYRITPGSKFGADYLLYPGDPTLFHAQFCVRLLPLRLPLLPALLSAASRGSHQARKHLLIASVEEGQGLAGGGAMAEEAGESAPTGGGSEAAATDSKEGFRIHYMTIGPVEGFG